MSERIIKVENCIEGEMGRPLANNCPFSQVTDEAGYAECCSISDGNVTCEFGSIPNNCPLRKGSITVKQNFNGKKETAMT